MAKENDLELITRQIVDNFNPRRLVLFGSRAAGKAAPDSDIDLCVIEDIVPNKSEAAVNMYKILRDFMEPLDILVFNSEEFDRRKDIWGTVQYEIDKKGKVLYERRD
jgi:predicted nucleotidyltransferase